jgi:hypothetical protein
VGAIVVVYWFFSSLGSGKPTVAKQPAIPRPSATPLAQRPMRKITPQPRPTTAPVIKPTPKPAVIAASPKPSPAAITSPKPIPVAEPVEPPKVIASKPAIPTVDLAAIQTQLGSAIAGIGDNLIHSVQAQDVTDKLSVALEENWSGLSASEQTQVAQTLLERSQQLEFKKFELRNKSGELIARSPLIGTDVIILKRQDTSGDA